MRKILLLMVILLLGIVVGCESKEHSTSDAFVESDGKETTDDLAAIQEVEKDGFVLTYQDEFDGEVLDPSFWYPGLPHDWGTTSLNDESQSYTEENVVIEDGMMKLIMEKRTVKGNKGGRSRSFSYASGCVNTYELVKQKYGIWEISAKMPSALGSWPAFWLMPENGNVYSPVGAEIDIFENLATWGDDIQFGIHYDGYAEDHQHFAAPKVTIPNIANEFHVYTLEWHPDYIRLFVDGEQVAEYTGRAVPMSEHYVILNAAMGGWGGDIDDAALPDSMDIEYLRIYQYEDMEEIERAQESKLKSLMPEASGLDFEQDQLSDIIDTAGMPYDSSLVRLSDDETRIVSGDVSYVANTMDEVDGDYDIYVSPLRAMSPFKNYTVAFDYKINEKGKEDKLYYYVSSISDPEAKIGYRELDPGSGAPSAKGVLGHVETNIGLADVDDAVLVIGIRNQVSVSLDNISIVEYTPPSVGLDFETIELEKVITGAALYEKGIYTGEQVSLTWDERETISGEVSLRGDSTVINETWNEFYQSPAGAFEANSNYKVFFNYKVVEKEANAYFYALGRSMSKAMGAPDLLGWKEWYDEAGGQGKIEMDIQISDYEDYYLIIGINQKGILVIDNILIEKAE